MRNIEMTIARKLKFEPMGVERIPDNKRKPPQIFNVSCALYASAEGITAKELYHLADDLHLVFAAVQSDAHRDRHPGSNLWPLGPHLGHFDRFRNVDRNSVPGLH